MPDSDINKAIEAIIIPSLKIKFIDIASVVNITNTVNSYNVSIIIYIPAKSLINEVQDLILQLLKQDFNIHSATINCNNEITRSLPETIATNNLSQVKNSIAIVAGKGGVGKSTTAANLALSLASQGAKVGILDADIFGPSMKLLFNIDKNSEIKTENQHFHPLISNGIKIMSIAFLITDDSPAIWRGPMASRMLLQMLNFTLWGDLDYLIIDFPPGTSDIPLTLAQKAPISAAVYVTTRQQLAIADVKKSIEMFDKLSINNAGIIENMSDFCCSNCQHIEPIFNNNIDDITNSYNTKVLGKIPLSIELSQAGNMVHNLTSNSKISELYQYIALNIAITLKNYNKLP
jgi:ATP-binding protein involved in chromosome partitioning